MKNSITFCLFGLFSTMYGSQTERKKRPTSAELKCNLIALQHQLNQADMRQQPPTPEERDAFNVEIDTIFSTIPSSSPDKEERETLFKTATECNKQLTTLLKRPQIPTISISEA